MERLIALDTNCFVYFLQGAEHPETHQLMRQVFELVEAGRLRALASVLAMAELLVGPKEMGQHDWADTLYIQLKTFPNLDFVPVDEPVALAAADLRASFGFKTPDAIHLATAAVHRADVFVSNDARLAKPGAPVRIVRVTDLPELLSASR